MKDPHKHKWELYLPSAEGYFSKRNDNQTNDVDWYLGSVHECTNKPCDTFLFKPHEKGLFYKECEMENSMIGTIAKTATEALEWWDKDEPVMTIEMGGIGPSYEQTIHIAVFELFRRFHQRPVAELIDVLEPAIYEINREKDLKLSGAQAGVIMNFAYRCLKDGYRETIESFDRERRIQVTKYFPCGCDCKYQKVGAIA